MKASKYTRWYRTQFAPEGAVQSTAVTALAYDANATLDGVFRARMKQSPHAVAYLQFDARSATWHESTWADMGREVGRWQAALASLGLQPGERVAIMLGNRREWVVFDQAALGLGLVTVPIYTSDRADNVDWVLQDAGCRLLLIDGPEQWQALAPIRATLDRLTAVISLQPILAVAPNLHHVAGWLPEHGHERLAASPTQADDLATLVYTSGTTGRPKGVMLSHGNILFNVWAGLQAVKVRSDDLMLSFLPLSHMFERSIGYYLPMVAGCRVAYARSIQQLPEDLVSMRPTVLISVPRIYQRVHARIQESVAAAPQTKQRLFAKALEVGWQHFLHGQGRAPWTPGLLLQPVLDRLVGAKVRAKLGGRLRFAISGGAPLPADISRFFIALGVDILQGYGLTESSPVISVNRQEDNEPASVGPPLDGIEVAIGANDELLTRSPSVMLGFWQNEAATRAIVDADGWLHTGDQARLGPRGHITITGRIKDILVLSTGEKVSPASVEQALAACPLVEQIMLVGDDKPFLSALLVPKPGALAQVAQALALPAADDAQAFWRQPAVQGYLLDQLLPLLHAFPGYAKLVRVTVVTEAWSQENNLLTPTLKLRRREVLRRYQAQVEEMYAGHTR
jgi:long-chain acyl-CoA synthetase